MPRHATLHAATLSDYLAQIADAERLLHAAGDRPGAIEFAARALNNALSDATPRTSRVAWNGGHLTEKRHPILGRYIGAATAAQAAA